MANVVKHRFASGKIDGADGTQVQPSHWNDGHAFTGGNAGDVLTRDPTDATYGAKWAPLPTPAPIGVWVPIPFNASNFGTDGGGSVLTVALADINTYATVLIGQTFIVSFFVHGIISGALSLNLYLGIAEVLDDDGRYVGIA